MAREQNFTIDEEGFAKAMQAQRERAQSASNFGTDYTELLNISHQTEFTGYDTTMSNATVLEVIVDNQSVNSVEPGQNALVILDTAFYAESGGQVGDTGDLLDSSGSVLFVVQDTQKVSHAFGHQGVAQQSVNVGDIVNTAVDASRRQAIKLNHSATHLLHAALRELLGEHVQQKGSLVDHEKLRFDFAHFEAITNEQLSEIESLVNAQIRENHLLNTQLMELDAAKAAGAMALFGEKYDEQVRVVSMGAFSTELCGGTHVNATGDIGFFKITSEGGIASGVRRIEAVTGELALNAVQTQQTSLQTIAAVLKSDLVGIVDKAQQQQDTLKKLEKLTQLKQKLASSQGNDLLSQVKKLEHNVATNLSGIEAKAAGACWMS